MPSAAAKVPLWHGTDAALELAPSTGRYVPLAVSEQRTAPVWLENVPIGQGEHSAAPGAAANVPSGDVGHGKQSSAQLEPSDGRNVPAGHGTHAA
jgi:hypothetical protein